MSACITHILFCHFVLQIKSLRCSPALQPTSFLSEDHAGSDCDVIVTGGERNLRIWSFQRPTNRSGRYLIHVLFIAIRICIIYSLKLLLCNRCCLRDASLVDRSARFGKVSCNAPKTYTCIGFTSPRKLTAGGGGSSNTARVSVKPSNTTADDPYGGLCDIVSGSDNGMLYLWRAGLCVQARAIIPHEGTMNCLQVHRGGYRGGDLIFCGGAGTFVFFCYIISISYNLITRYDITLLGILLRRQSFHCRCDQSRHFAILLYFGKYCWVIS